MIWREHGKTENLPTPSSYSADIEDTDNDSYTSKKTGALIDNPIAVGMLKLSMSWNLNSEAQKSGKGMGHPVAEASWCQPADESGNVHLAIADSSRISVLSEEGKRNICPCGSCPECGSVHRFPHQWPGTLCLPTACLSASGDLLVLRLWKKEK